MCPPIHLANMTGLVLLLAHPSPQPKQQIDPFSHFCTANGRKSLCFTMGDPFPQNCPFSWGIWTPSNIILWSILSPQSEWHHDQCSRFHTGDRRVSYTLQWDAPFPPQNLPFPWGIWTPHLIRGSLVPPESTTQTASRSVQLFFTGLTSVTDRLTDHATRSVTIDCICVRSGRGGVIIPDY